MLRLRLISLLLALAALAVYLPVVSHGFINYDDGDYVTENKMVQAGLTVSGIKWAFTSFYATNWHPLTWLSHMLDCELFGLNPLGPHCVNVLFHTANTLLLFALWLRLTQRRENPGPDDPSRESDALWPAAFIAALFAVHPLNVETVAWIAERKNVLTTFFGWLMLLCYARYVLKDGGRPSLSYGLALLFFACGLMCKAMIITFPFVMLLLDYWPLQRLNRAAFGRLLVEKIPFFLLTTVSCVITYKAESHGSIKSLATVPLVTRLEETPVAIATYLLKMFWPTHLAIIYPMPDFVPLAAFITSSAVLILITVIVWLERKRNPFLIVGWLWFLGTLVPVVGVVKIGDIAMADRHTYIPCVGIFMTVAFGFQKLSRRFSPPKYVLPVAAILVLAALTVVTEKQLQYWRDDESLFSHTMQVTSNNVDAIVDYGAALESDGKITEAMALYRQAEKLKPAFFMPHVDLANLLYYGGKPEEALEEYRLAEQSNPNVRMVHDGAGVVLASLGQFAEATNEFYAAMRLDPTSPSPHFYLGIALAANKELPEATNEFTKALSLSPNDPSIIVAWGKALLQQGHDAEAVDKFHQALQLDPENYQTLTYVAHVLAADENQGIRNGQAALILAQKANDLTGGSQPLVEDVLGMAYAENGQFDEAQKAVTGAISQANSAGMKAENVTAMQKRLQLYQNHQPWRESFLLNTPKR